MERDEPGTPTDAQSHDDQSHDDQSHDAKIDAARAESRATLLPEEAAVGSDDPVAQAKIILADSERRTEEGAAPTTFLEHRTSEQAL